MRSWRKWTRRSGSADCGAKRTRRTGGATAGRGCCTARNNRAEPRNASEDVLLRENVSRGPQAGGDAGFADCCSEGKRISQVVKGLAVGGKANGGSGKAARRRKHRLPCLYWLVDSADSSNFVEELLPRLEVEKTSCKLQVSRLGFVSACDSVQASCNKNQNHPADLGRICGSASQRSALDSCLCRFALSSDSVSSIDLPRFSPAHAAPEH